MTSSHPTLRPAAPWTLADLPPQTGRTVIITGAGSGIGLETARALVSAGAHVVMAVRNAERTREAAASMTTTGPATDTAIGATTGSATSAAPRHGRTAGTVEIRALDLADLASVRGFAASWDRPVDVLINNAGVANVPPGRTADGFETHFGTNHLGHFALTNLLLPRITDRVVTIASNAHKNATLDLDDPNWRRRPYRASAAYGQSKLANLLFTLELQRRLTKAGSPLLAVAAHPGAATTGLNRHLGPFMTLVATIVGRLAMQNAAAGALPALFAATQNLEGAAYIGPDGRGELRGHPARAGRTPTAQDPSLARQLWTLSEDLTSTAFPSPGK
ncbi:SDR family NAD(P)-dependent oxidoreductase [Streptomyces sp. GMY02]|uniref:SDR family NAD(P)-dependent oxidoreductase n=1 Tax=Streptomyces sp. GMY02 TaxID=1333528 RepID=UPI001C2C5D06|nr:SDR family NAD(P)-dependent oxidoreductase [Streptomyces sp. GMY02]QXE36255.1 SDR family NAD(P)-dependent oxidoreductase [Streptomyces sp. GMY02]